MQYAGVRNSGVLVGSVTTTLSGNGNYWSLEMGQAVWKWLMTGGNQPAEALQRESQRDKYSDLILPCPVSYLAFSLAKPSWKLVCRSFRSQGGE